MKRFLLLCLFIVPHAFGMEAGMPPHSNGSMVPVPVFNQYGQQCFGDDGPRYELVFDVPQPMVPGVDGAQMPPSSNGVMPTERLPQAKEETLADSLLRLAHAAHASQDEDTERAAVVCMEEVEERVAEEKPANLILLLKQRGVHTHVMALLDDGRPSSAYRAQLLGKFGDLLLKASGEDDSVLDDGLHCVLKALKSDGLGEREKREVREIKKQYYKRLGIKTKKKKTRRKKKSAKSKVTAYAGADTEGAQQGENIARPLRFLTKERPLLPRRPPEEQKELPKKKKKKAKKKKKKESPLDMSQFTGPWDQRVMQLLGRKYTSYDQAIEYLTRLDTCFEIVDQRLKKGLFDQLRDTPPMFNAQQNETNGQSDGLSLVQQQDCYVIGRLLLENAGDKPDRDQVEKKLPFELIYAAVRAGSTPAQLYLATSEKTGLTKRRRVLYLMGAFKKGLKKGERKQALGIAQRYTKEGYFLPLLAQIAGAVESGTLDAYLDELEKKFPPIRIYHTDEEYEQIVSHSPFKKGANTHWSAQAIRATMNSIQLLRAIESSNGTDIEVTLKKMSDEVIAIDTLSQEHPELSTLCSSCYSLLGRAYGWCGNMNNALKAHGKAMLDSGYHETTLLPYVRYVLHPKSGVNLAEKGSSKFIQTCLEMLVNGAENYKASAYLLYAAFHSHRNDMEKAEFFVKKAGKQMEHEHNEDERAEEFYRQVIRLIYERKREKEKKRTIVGMRKEKEEVKEELCDGLDKASDAISLAEKDMEENPVRALAYLRNAVFTENLFGMFHIDEGLQTRYTAVIEKIEQAKGQLDADRLSHLKLVLKELREKKQRIDELCTRENGTYAVPIPREKD